jgi:hypothetical protein
VIATAICVLSIQERIANHVPSSRANSHPSQRSGRLVLVTLQGGEYFFTPSLNFLRSVGLGLDFKGS